MTTINIPTFTNTFFWNNSANEGNNSGSSLANPFIGTSDYRQTNSQGVTFIEITNTANYGIIFYRNFVANLTGVLDYPTLNCGSSRLNQLNFSPLGPTGRNFDNVRVEAKWLNESIHYDGGETIRLTSGIPFLSAASGDPIITYSGSSFNTQETTLEAKILAATYNVFSTNSNSFHAARILKYPLQFNFIENVTPLPLPTVGSTFNQSFDVDAVDDFDRHFFGNFGGRPLPSEYPIPKLISGNIPSKVRNINNSNSPMAGFPNSLNFTIEFNDSYDFSDRNSNKYSISYGTATTQNFETRLFFAISKGNVIFLYYPHSYQGENFNDLTSSSDTENRRHTFQMNLDPDQMSAEPTQSGTPNFGRGRATYLGLGNDTLGGGISFYIGYKVKTRNGKFSIPVFSLLKYIAVTS